MSADIFGGFPRADGLGCIANGRAAMARRLAVGPELRGPSACGVKIRRISLTAALFGCPHRPTVEPIACAHGTFAS